MKKAFPSPSEILPHAYPFIMLDKIIEFEEKVSIVCIKNVSLNDEYLGGHYQKNTNFPALPQVLVLEAMVQSSGLVLGNTKDKVAYLCLIKEATFEKSVVAGDQLVITSRITQSFTPFYVFEAVATVDSEIASKAVITLSLAVKGTI